MKNRNNRGIKKRLSKPLLTLVVSFEQVLLLLLGIQLLNLNIYLVTRECDWDFRNQHESNYSKSAIAKLEQRV